MTIELTSIPLHPLERQDKNKDKDTQQRQPQSDLDLDLDLLPIIISGSNTLTRFGAWNLYLSHALSTWNARTYEFGATLFTVAAFPHTLFAQSMRGLCTTFAALCLSSFVGRWIDNAPSRIRTLLITISANRASVLLACLGWIFLVPGPIPSSSSSAADLLPGLIIRRRRTFDVNLYKSTTTANNNELDPSSNNTMAKAPWIFAIVIGLGICENLSGIGNMIAMEREWVPILAAAAATPVNPQSLSPSPGGPACNPQAKRAKQSSYTLTHLNAVTRRIDLLCKLFAPVFISLVILSSSMFVGVVVVAFTSTVSWGIEVWCARLVWRTNPSLQRAKVFLSTNTTTASSPSSSSSSSENGSWWRKWIPSALLYTRQKRQLQAFFATDIWIPALSLTMLHFSVLAYSATFITFLLNSGFSLFLITSARVISGIVEVSSTFVAPLSIRYLAPAAAEAAAAAATRLPGPTAGEKRKKKNKKGLSMEEEERREREEEGFDDDDEQQGFLLLAEDELDDQGEGCSRNKGRGRDKRHLVGLARSGLWGISLQLGCLIPVVLAISQIHPASSSYSSSSPSPLIITISMFSFLCLSRLGLWVFDISIQELSQLCVPPDSLASFAGTSRSFVAGFGLCQWVLVAIISKPEHFVWLGTISAATVGGALGMYVFWFARRVGGRARGRERDWLVWGG